MLSKLGSQEASVQITASKRVLVISDGNIYYIALYPDVDRPDGMWGVNQEERAAFLEECSAVIPEVVEDLHLWIQQWKERIYDDPAQDYRRTRNPYSEKYALAWKELIDERGWLDEGDRICDAIESNTRYKVARLYQGYREHKTYRNGKVRDQQ
ncbi:hypothetical protein F7230_02465 [Corynebacterium sp. 320]|nr:MULTISPECIES: hypothetical protein [unclassified Corynebacterium]KAB1503987.1 hypothetical protein F7230_02465 [Corynebacterium sp. 320]KAB1552914.1 hypothetical protein F7233_04130 [Corynebacterium sp. 321]KAB3528123.1 hypothetical protein F8354_02465 [Corynebacterium sp. 250]KAB3540389.1 hypothetical protein F8390_03875 [Corynebacterium sp. 366]